MQFCLLLPLLKVGRRLFVFVSTFYVWRCNEELGGSLRKIKIVCTGHRRVMGFSEAKLVLPTSCFFAWSHVQNVTTEGSRCEVGLRSCIKNAHSKFCENRSCVFKENWSGTLNTPRACWFLRLPFPKWKKRMLKTFPAHRSHWVSITKPSLSIKIFTLRENKNN
jgi:hypothetical protein